MTKTEIPRPPLSRDRVIAAAVALADAESIAALSMRRLAEALRVEAMSLYNHVANKDAVLDGMVDHVVAEIELPGAAIGWRAAMFARANSAHRMLLRHPWATQMMVSRFNVGPAMLRYVDATLGCLLNAGFGIKLADQAWNTLDGHIYGFTLQRQNFPIKPDDYASAACDHLPMIPSQSHPHLRAMALEVIAGRHDGLHDFTFGLNLILDGLEGLLPQN